MSSIKIRCQTSHGVSLPPKEELLPGEHSRCPFERRGKRHARATDQGQESTQSHLGDRPAGGAPLAHPKEKARGSGGGGGGEGGPKHLLQFTDPLRPNTANNAEAASLVSAAPLYGSGLRSTQGPV